MGDDRRENWVSLSQVAAWVMAAVGSLFVVLSGLFAEYLASNIEEIKTNVAVMNKDTAYAQSDIAKLELKLEQTNERVTKLELRIPLIGGSMHER